MRRDAGIPLLTLLLLGLLLRGAEAAEEAVLNADLLRYDPRTRLIHAEGNVRLTRPGTELTARRGEGTVGGDAFRLTGDVRGRMKAEGLAIRCDALSLIDSDRTQILEATGNVLLTRGEDRVVAQRLRWTKGFPRYVATGDVDARFESHAIRAAEVGRDGETLWGRDVRRYEDGRGRFVLSAEKADGRIVGGEVTELTATGALVLDLRGQEGKSVRVTGDKGVFSQDRGTIVVTGNARAVQEGRIVTAESLVLHMDDRRIEALGRPRIVFPIPERKGKGAGATPEVPSP